MLEIVAKLLPEFIAQLRETGLCRSLVPLDGTPAGNPGLATTGIISKEPDLDKEHNIFICTILFISQEDHRVLTVNFCIVIFEER